MKKIEEALGVMMGTVMVAVITLPILKLLGIWDFLEMLSLESAKMIMKLFNQ